MNILKLEYPTHTLKFKQIGKYVHVTCILNDIIYYELVIRSKNIDDERIGINRLFQAIFLGVDSIEIFDNEIDYYGFCTINDLKFENQSWFKVGFFKGELNEALIISKNSSIQLLERLYPDVEIKTKSHFQGVKEKIRIEKDNKDCSNQIKKILTENNITRLYHFTDEANVPSIMKLKGLYSNEYLRNNKISILNSATSENSKSIDIWKGLGNYIHLGFEQTHPMMFTSLKNSQLKNPVVFEISTDVILLNDTMFSNINAIDNEAIIGREFSNFESISLNQFHHKNYNNLDNQAKKLYQAEVLVKKHIPIDLILNYKQITQKFNYDKSRKLVN